MGYFNLEEIKHSVCKGKEEQWERMVDEKTYLMYIQLEDRIPDLVRDCVTIDEVALRVIAERELIRDLKERIDEKQIEAWEENN